MTGPLAGVLVLWDVDHTLVDAAGVGVEAFEAAFVEVFGRRMAGRPPMAGRTDRAILTDVLRASGVPVTEPVLEALRRAAESALAGLDGALRTRGRVLPGAADALAAVARAAAVQSVLTGNIRAFAEAKLRAFGLTGYLDLDVGGYGWAHEVRARLVAPARERARRAYGDGFAGRRTVLVGDTPLDVAAALATGAGAVGVATGRYGAAELATAGAHAVLPDLTTSADVLAALRTASNLAS
jgi:phosphoglycolate phosphatase